MTELDMDALQGWVGRAEERHDVITLAHARRMAALLDKSALVDGDVLPPLWHWIYFAPDVPQQQLDVDGHPKRGGFLPPVPLPRRMWAGGRLTFHAPLHIGEAVTQRSKIVSVKNKTGKRGALVFLTLRHDVSNAHGVAITEEQDIVYRKAGSTTQPDMAAEAPEPVDWRHSRDTDPVLLFRYSALTFNGHRIHYDLPYATGEEGYPGLVVHGPLTATLLMEAFVQETGKAPSTFAFRGQAPLFCGGRMQLCGRREAGGFDLWAEGPGGYTAMSAQVTARGGSDDH